MGYEKKRKPLRNVKDKAESEDTESVIEHRIRTSGSDDLTRKSAHFSMVITKETFAEAS
jgi:hypothetical protein